MKRKFNEFYNYNSGICITLTKLKTDNSVMNLFKFNIYSKNYFKNNFNTSINLPFKTKGFRKKILFETKIFTSRDLIKVFINPFTVFKNDLNLNCIEDYFMFYENFFKMKFLKIHRIYIYVTRINLDITNFFKSFKLFIFLI